MGICKLYDVFTLTNGADPDEMPFFLHFFWVFTVCLSTYLGVLHIQGLFISVGV